jgi:putative oxidoreductase
MSALKFGDHLVPCHLADDNKNTREKRMDLNRLISTNGSWGSLVLRLVTGTIFIVHGLPKFGLGGDRGLTELAGWLGSIGIPLPMLNAVMLASSEAIGGAMLIIGFLTRVAAATQVIAMLVAVFLVHYSHGLAGEGGYQWALLLGAAAFALMMDGAGRFSVDRMMSEKH